MRLGREATAARQRASRLAGLAGDDPLHPTPRHRARGRRETCWLAWFYRRGTTGAAARGFGAIFRLLAREGRHCPARCIKLMTSLAAACRFFLSFFVPFYDNAL